MRRLRRLAARVRFDGAAVGGQEGRPLSEAVRALRALEETGTVEDRGKRRRRRRQCAEDAAGELVERRVGDDLGRQDDGARAAGCGDAVEMAASTTERTCASVTVEPVSADSVRLTSLATVALEAASASQVRTSDLVTDAVEEAAVWTVRAA
jgi:hypothetical protein